jgi:AraC-like DNA-binding protein
MHLLPDFVRYGSPADPFHLEFNRRSGHYSMDVHHFHHFYEVYYLFTGERGYFIKDRSYIVRQGDIVLIDPNEVHKTFDIGVPNHERVVVYYESSFFERYYPEDGELLLSSFGHHPVLRLNMKERAVIDGLFDAFFREMTEKPYGFELRLRHMAAELLLFISRFSQKRRSIPEEQLSPIHRKVMDIVKYINSHYNEPIDLETISRQFYVSYSYLSSVFKEVTGFSFSDYVNTVRIKEAQKLLRETDWKITDIAEHTGFNNFSHFGKVFKKLSHLSPRAYRQQHSNKNAQ